MFVNMQTAPTIKTCRKCAGRAMHMVTLPTRTDHGGYELYQCVLCKFIEWVPHEPGREPRSALGH
jgi:DNA-directed RNA polymerase subunit M/transcription elongation factor TFIIS